MDRELVASALILGMAVAIAAFIMFKWYHSHDRSYRRRKRSEIAAHAKLMTEQSRSPDERR